MASMSLSPWPPPGGHVNSKLSCRPRPLDELGVDVLQKGLRLFVYEIDAYERPAEFRDAMTAASDEADATPWLPACAAVALIPMSTDT